MDLIMMGWAEITKKFTSWQIDSHDKVLCPQLYASKLQHL